MRLLSVLLLFIYGCSSNSGTNSKLDLDQVYIGAGMEKYYLADLPRWANFSSSGKCQRSEPIRFVNFETMYKSYSFTYEELIQFQFMLNKKFYSYKESTGRETVFLKDEVFIMHNVHEQILGGARDFIAPKFNRINLVWIDEALISSEKLNDLKKLMYSEEMEKGHPIFISLCLNAVELEKFIQKLGFNKLGVKGISQSMFSPYNTNMEKANEFLLDFNALMPNKNLYFYGAFIPSEFKGISKIQKY